MEIPNNAKPEELMNFKKFAQSKKGFICNEEKVWIEGKFKNKGNEEVFEGDNFYGNEVLVGGKPINAETIYRTYLEWFNYTLRPGEKERIFVSAKIGNKKNGN